MSLIDYNRLLNSVTYYLSYQDRIGRGFMIAESSLKYPVADYLTGLKTPIDDIQIEFTHPQFKKRRIDIVTLDSSKTKVENAFEFKISQFSTRHKAEKKRIFNDLMRLYLVSKYHGVSCYFFIAGEYEKFMQCFRSINDKMPPEAVKDLPNPQGFYTEWFGFKLNEEKVFDVNGAKDGTVYKSIYKDFMDDYKQEEDVVDFQLPEKLTTTCVEISALSREHPTPYVGGIWKIE